MPKELNDYCTGNNNPAAGADKSVTRSTGSGGGGLMPRHRFDGIFQCGHCGADLPPDDEPNADFVCVYCDREFCCLDHLELHDVDECESDAARAAALDNELEAMRCDYE